MIKVKNQMSLGDKTIIMFDSPIPTVRFKKLIVGGKEYEPEVVYGIENGLGIAAKGNFTGKEVKFE